MKLKKGVKKILIILLLVIIGSLLIYYLVFYNHKSAKKIKILTSIKEYGYELKDNKSAEYKKLFYQLEKELKKDPVKEEEYVKIISKMFILDYYSLEEKLAKTDVGGSDFVHSKARKDFFEKSEDTMYKYVESNLYGGRNQKLPTVKEVTVKNVEQTPFIYGDSTDENAYKVEVEWTYTDTSTSSGYQTEGTLVFVHEDQKLSLVELK